MDPFSHVQVSSSDVPEQRNSSDPAGSSTAGATTSKIKKFIKKLQDPPIHGHRKSHSMRSGLMSKIHHQAPEETEQMPASPHETKATGMPESERAEAQEWEEKGQKQVPGVESVSQADPKHQDTAMKSTESPTVGFTTAAPPSQPQPERPPTPAESIEEHYKLGRRDAILERMQNVERKLEFFLKSAKEKEKSGMKKEEHVDLPEPVKASPKEVLKDGHILQEHEEEWEELEQDFLNANPNVGDFDFLLTDSKLSFTQNHRIQILENILSNPRRLDTPYVPRTVANAVVGFTDVFTAAHQKGSGLPFSLMIAILFQYYFADVDFDKGIIASLPRSLTSMIWEAMTFWIPFSVHIPISIHAKYPPLAKVRVPVDLAEWDDIKDVRVLRESRDNDELDEQEGEDIVVDAEMDDFVKDEWEQKEKIVYDREEYNVVGYGPVRTEGYLQEPAETLALKDSFKQWWKLRRQLHLGWIPGLAGLIRVYILYLVLERDKKVDWDTMRRLFIGPSEY